MATSLSRFLRRLRARLATRLGRSAPLLTVQVEFETTQFVFTAPRVIAERARDRGIELVICRTLLAELPDGGSFIDVGANFGFVTMVGARAVGSDGSVLSLEIDPSIARTVEATARENGLGEVVSVRAEAVGAPGGEGRTVDELIGAVTVDAVKIDVDGTEPEILAGMVDLVDRCHPLLVVEVPVDRAAAVRTLDWLADRYEHVVGMSGEPVTSGSGPYPPNVFASTDSIEIKR